jgi:hypothetical protein
MTDFVVAMLAGATAGMVCDVALFPLGMFVEYWSVCA